MKKVSTLFDALRNEKFAIAIQDDYGVKYYGSEGQGKEWSDWANSLSTKTIDANNIPAGIIQGPYKNISEHSLKSLLTAFGNNISEIGNSYTDSKSYSYKSSVKMDNGARVPAVMDTPIGHFTKSQYSSAVNYKGLAIRTQIKEGSFLFEARVNNYAFNFDNWMYNSTPSKAEIKSLRHRIDTNVGRSSERRLGMKFKAALVERDGRHRVGYAQTLETKSLEDSLELKGIGQRIGGGARIGRRAARSMAMFDPKAWDGDGDGVVQEGTPFERPAIPGINDRATGGAVDADAAKKAWKEFQKNPGSSTPSRELSPARRAMREGSRSVGRQVLTNRKPAAAGRKMPASKPIKRSGIASRTQADIDKEVSKQVLDMASEVLYKRSTTDELRSLVNGLGPDGGTELSREQENEINEIIDAFDNGELENMEDLISEISATLRKLPPRTQNQSGMRSRVGKAQMDRQVNGLASRSGRSKAKSKLKATPGRDKVDEQDGSLWASLTPEQQDVVKKNTQAAYDGLQNYIKKDRVLSTWWDEFLRLPRKKGATDADGNEWSEKSRISGEAFTSFEVAINRSIDGANSEIQADERALAAMRPTGSDAEIKKAENRIANKKKQVQRIQKILDDLKTYDQMDKADDWSLLEHLHPEQRKKSFGLGLSKSEAGLTVSPFADGKLPKGMKVGEPSTIFEEIGGVKRAKPRIIGEKGDAKLADFADRILRPNPVRAERRRLRKAGKGKTFTEESPREKISKVKRRISKAKRQVQSKIRGKRNPENIESALEKVRKRNTPLIGRDKDDNPVISRETIEGFAKLLRGYKPSEKRTKDGATKGKNADSFLGQIWDSQNFSALPTAITEEEARELISLGWIPIQRGHGGTTPSQAASWAEDYIYDPRRFITGEGGQAVGPGEYWAHPESTGWDSWIRGQSSNTATLAFLPPNSKVLTEAQASKLQQDGNSIANAIGGYITGAGSGGKAEELDPQDLVREIKQHLSSVLPMDSGVWNSEVGKVYSQIFSLMEAGNSAEGKQLYAALQFMLKQRDSHKNIYAMILGYDGVDYGKSDGRLLMFNRGALSVVGEAVVPLDKLKAIAAGQPWPPRKDA